MSVGKRKKIFSGDSFGWTIGHVLSRSYFPDTKEGELKYWDLLNIRPEWRWFNGLKSTMGPLEMEEWINKENVLELIKLFLSKQTLIEKEIREIIG